MNYLIFSEGMAIGLLLFSSVFSLILWFKKIERNVNFNYFFFVLFISLFIYYNLKNNLHTDIEVFIIYEKKLNVCIFLAGIFFVRLLSNLTLYKPKKTIFILNSIFIIMIIFAVVSPYGITFSSIDGFERKYLYNGFVVQTVKGKLSFTVWFLIALIIFLLGYTIKSMRYLYLHGNREDYKILLFSVLLGLGGILSDNILRVAGINGYFYIQDFAFLGFTGIVSQRNFQNILNMSKIKQELINNEERFRTLVSNVPGAVYRCYNDEYYTMLFISESINDISGYEASSFMNNSELSYASIIHPEDIESIRATVNNSIKNKICFSIEYRIIDKGNKIKWVFERGQGVFSQGNKLLYIDGVILDISDGKEAELNVLKSEIKFRSLFENANDAIFIMNGDKIIECNSKTSEMFDSPKSQIIGNTPYNLSPSYQSNGRKSSELIKDKINEALNGGTNIFEWQHCKLDKTAFETEVSLNKVEVSGEVYIQAIVRDITLKKQAEKELQNYSRFIKYVINSVPVAIISTDADLNVTLSNSYSERFKSDSDSSLLLQKFPKLKFVKEYLVKSVENQITVADTILIAGDEGEIKYFNVTISPLVMESIPGSVILVEDVTEKKQMEQVIIQSEKVMSIAGLAAGMAHEINNPLGTIVQGCQNIVRRTSSNLPKNLAASDEIGIDFNLIKKYFQERQIFEILESMKLAAGKASEIIKNMLQFSRRSESKKVAYDLTKLIEQTIELANNDYDLKKKYDFRHITIIKDYAPDIPLIKLTVTEIEQVIFNIISNAAQAMCTNKISEKTPTIIIRLIKEKHYINIQIEDNGPGIPEKIIKRIFEPFFTTKEPGTGTGLGLSVAYLILTTNYNGTITVNSTVGVGTTFNIILPYEAEVQ